MKYSCAVTFSFEKLPKDETEPYDAEALEELEKILHNLSRCPHYEWRHNNNAIKWTTTKKEANGGRAEVTLESTAATVDTSSIEALERVMSDLTEATTRFYSADKPVFARCSLSLTSIQPNPPCLVV